MQRTLKSYPSPQGQNFYRVDEVVTIETNAFVFEQQWTGFEHLAKGTLIGHDGPRAIIAPFEPTVLVMPTRRLYPGKNRCSTGAANYAERLTAQ